MSITTFRYHTEIIDGQEIEKPMPKWLHARIQTQILVLLSASQGFHGLAANSELNVLIGNGDRLVPDVTVSSSSPITVDGDLLAKDAILCVEIASPGQTLGNLLDKAERLIRAGVLQCWVIWGEPMRFWTVDAKDGILEVATLSIETNGFICSFTRETFDGL